MLRTWTKKYRHERDAMQDDGMIGCRTVIRVFRARYEPFPFILEALQASVLEYVPWDSVNPDTAMFRALTRPDYPSISSHPTSLNHLPPPM